MSSNFNDKQASIINLSDLKNLSKHIFRLVDHAEKRLSQKHSMYYSVVDSHCKDIQSIIKNIAAENSIEKIVEAESMLVGMASNIEECKGASSAHAKNMESFIKQADALSSVIDHCNYYKTYKDYEIVMRTHTKDVRSCEKYGLPEDAVFHNLNNNISALKKAKDDNIGHPEYDNLTDIRIKALTRAKILYMQRQLPFMIEFSERNHDKRLARSFALNRANIEKNIQTLLDKSDEVLGIQRDKEQTQNQTQQTQEPASNKKTKSSSDIER